MVGAGSASRDMFGDRVENLSREHDFQEAERGFGESESASLAQGRLAQ